MFSSTRPFAGAISLAIIADVAEGDVPGVGARMNGDAWRAGGETDPGGFDDARHAPRRASCEASRPC